MPPVRHHHPAWGFLVGLMLCVATAAQAVEGRDFAGFYEVRNVTELRETVSVTLVLEIFNYNGADVFNATLTLEDPLLLETPYATFSGVSVTDGERVRLEGVATLPRHEYTYWQEGGTPTVRIAFSDEAGHPVEQMVELIPMLLTE